MCVIVILLHEEGQAAARDPAGYTQQAGEPLGHRGRLLDHRDVCPQTPLALRVIGKNFVCEFYLLYWQIKVFN